MKRKELQNFLEDQLKKLQKVHAVELMKARRHQELEKILKEIRLDFIPIVLYHQVKTEPVYQSEEEIPKGLLYELALYIQQSNLKDNAFFKNYKDYQNLLLELREEFADDLADKIDKRSLCNYTIEELLRRNITEKTVKRFLEKQLKILQKAHVADLMKIRRAEEVEEILKDIELDFSLIKKYFNEKREPVYQSEEEIPKGLLYELALYIQQSNLMDYVFFEDAWEYQDMLLEIGEEVADDIAKRIEEDNLRNYTVKELLNA